MSKNNYIDKKEFHQAFVDWNRVLKDNPDAPLPDYIARCFITMADEYAKKPRFNRYTWIDDMKGNAVYNCFKYAKSYNPEASAEAFSYFTSAIHNIFLQTINKNNKEVEKINMYKNSSLPLYQVNEGDENIIISGLDDLRNYNDQLSLDKDRCNNLSDYEESPRTEETIDDILTKEITNFNREDTIEDEFTEEQDPEEMLSI